MTGSKIWIVGRIFGRRMERMLVVHFDGTEWSRLPTPNSDGSDQLFAVDAVSGSGVWAVGSDDRALALRWDGTSWSRGASADGRDP